MKNKEVNLSIPDYLYRECLKATKIGLFSNLSELVQAGIRRELKELFFLSQAEKENITWNQALKDLREEVKKVGGYNKSKEEIIQELRKIRRRIWEEEYKERYKNCFR